MSIQVPDAEIVPGHVFQRIVTFIAKIPPPINNYGALAFNHVTIALLPIDGEEYMDAFSLHSRQIPISRASFLQSICQPVVRGSAMGHEKHFPEFPARGDEGVNARPLTVINA